MLRDVPGLSDMMRRMMPGFEEAHREHEAAEAAEQERRRNEAAEEQRRRRDAAAEAAEQRLYQHLRRTEVPETEEQEPTPNTPVASPTEDVAEPQEPVASPAEPEQQPASSGQWACPICTFLTSMDEQFCGMCGAGE